MHLPHPYNISPLCLATQAEVSRYRSQEARILRNSAFWLVSTNTLTAY